MLLVAHNCAKLRKNATDFVTITLVNMKVTIRPVLWEKQIDKDGNAPIALSIAGGGKRTYHNTGIKVKPDNWDNGICSKDEPNYDIKNNRIGKMVADAERKVMLAQDSEEKITIEWVKSLFAPDKPKSPNFYNFTEKVLKTKNDGTKRRYGYELDKLKKYAGESLSFADITPKWLSAYQKYLLLKNHPNTVINAFKVIRHVFNTAIEEKLITHYPFADWQYPGYKAPKKQYLTLAECDSLFALLDKKISKEMKLVTAYFLLECFSGIRISDWHKFSVEKVVRNEEMIFTTTKTGTEVRLPLDLMPSLNRIISYIRDNNLTYKLPHHIANLRLKDIGPLADIDKVLTTHVARHTFATHSLSIGMSKESIAVAMGITDRQVGTYAKVDPNKLRTELKRLGGGV